MHCIYKELGKYSANPYLKCVLYDLSSAKLVFGSLFMDKKQWQCFIPLVIWTADDIVYSDCANIQLTTVCYSQTCTKLHFLGTKNNQTIFGGLCSDQTNTNKTKYLQIETNKIKQIQIILLFVSPKAFQNFNL